MSGRNDRYNPLEEYLINQCSPKLILTFDDIEGIINNKLPKSAYSHRPWWANENNGKHVQAKAWMNAGWKVEEVKLGEFVVFIRDADVCGPLSKREIMIGKKYRHFKGGEYLVLYVAKHSETLEEMVVYQALYNEHGIWVRPLDMFMGQKEVEGKLINRFEEIID